MTIDRILGPARTAGSRRLLALLAVMAGLAVVYLLLAPYPGPQEALYDSISFFSVVAILAGIHRHRPAHRVPWILLAAGLLLFAIGDLTWTLLELAGESPWPSAADIAYVSGYPVLMLAFLGIIWVRVGDGDKSGLLDAVILAGGVALVGWVTLLRPVVDMPGEPIETAISIAYPLGDLLLIGVVIGLLATPGARGPSFVLLAAALISQFAGDLLYAVQVADETFVDGGPLDLTWIASYLMLGAAALLPSMRHVAMPHPVRIAWLSPLRLAFLSLAMLVGPTLMLIHQDEDIAIVVAGTAILSLLVVLRLAIVVGALARDNAARRSLERELNHRATHDSLTGLANRRHFLEKLEAALGARTGDRDPVSVLFLDLDDFKAINDTLGHATGDALLSAVAGRLAGHLRAGDIAARMGGDEFGILLHADANAAMTVAQREVAALAEPVTVGDRALRVSGSIGVATARRDSTVVSLMSEADVAMYRAKSQGKGTACLAGDGMPGVAAAATTTAADGATGSLGTLRPVTTRA